MIKYQTVWQRDGLMLTRRFASFVSKGSRLFRGDKDYLKNIELGLIISLFCLTTMFVVSKKFEERKSKTAVALATLIVETADQTEQTTRTAAPSRPTVPIATEDEEVSEDETMDIYDFDTLSDPPPPPPPPMDSDEILFVAFSEPPSPVGGYAALHAKAIYPDIARLAGIEGTVLMNVNILKDGTVAEIRMLRAVSEVLDEAAKKAVLSVKWIPAKQREEPVSIWFAVPIEFRLGER